MIKGRVRADKAMRPTSRGRLGTGLLALGLGFTIAAAAFSLLMGSAGAVSSFASGAPEKRVEIPFDLGEVWYYARDGSKVLPDISLEWIAVVFRPEESAATPPEPAPEAPPTDGQAGGASEAGPRPPPSLLTQAREFVRRHEQLVDMLCDTNLLAEGCFFRMRPGMREQDLLPFLLALNQEPEIDYAHPTVVLNGKTYAFFDALEIKWKTEVDPQEKDRLLEQAHVREDRTEKVYRVDLFQIPLFKALDLLAEDVRVQEASPLLVQVRPAIRATFTLGMSGANLGDPIPFAYTVTFSDLVQIDPSSIASLSLRPDSIEKDLFDLKIDPYDYVKAVRESPLRITGRMKFYAPGQYTLPSLVVRYNCSTCSGTKDRSLQTQPATVRISSMVPAGTQPYTLIVPADPLALPGRETAYRTAARRAALQAGLAFLAALGVAVGLFLRSRQLRRRREAALEKRREDLTSQRLRELLSQPPQDPHWIHVEQAGRLLREYLAEKYGGPGLATGGSGEIFFKTLHGRLPGGLASRVQKVLQEIDTVIALEMDPYPGLERLAADLVAITAEPGSPS